MAPSTTGCADRPLAAHEGVLHPVGSLPQWRPAGTGKAFPRAATKGTPALYTRESSRGAHGLSFGHAHEGQGAPLAGWLPQR